MHTYHLTFVLPLLASMFLLSCLLIGSELTTIIDRAVNNQKIGELGTLDLAEKTTFSWDTLYVFSSGSFEDEMNEAMNIQYFTHDFMVPDRHSWVIFKKDDKVVRRFELSWEYYFSDLRFHNGELTVPRDSAIFRVKKPQADSPIRLSLEHK